MSKIDGSTTFVANSIELVTWKALATIRGGEVASLGGRAAPGRRCPCEECSDEERGSEISHRASLPLTGPRNGLTHWPAQSGRSPLQGCSMACRNSLKCLAASSGLSIIGA